MKIDKAFVELTFNLLCLLDNDAEKVAAWINAKNPNFGGLSPLDLIGLGKIKKVTQFVEFRLEEEGL